MSNKTNEPHHNNTIIPEKKNDIFAVMHTKAFTYTGNYQLYWQTELKTGNISSSYFCQCLYLE